MLTRQEGYQPSEGWVCGVRVPPSALQAWSKSGSLGS